MNKLSIFAIVASVAMLTACGSTKEPNRAEESAKLVEKVAPDWFTTPQNSQSAYKAIGDGVSGSMSGAINNAKVAAYESICQSAGATARSQSKQYRQDTESSSQQLNVSATKVFCPDVDVAGAVIEKQHLVRDGSRFRAFVLLSVDKGGALDKRVKANAEAEFKDLDKANAEYKAQQKQ